MAAGAAAAVAGVAAGGMGPKGAVTMAVEGGVESDAASLSALADSCWSRLPNLERQFLRRDGTPC